MPRSYLTKEVAAKQSGRSVRRLLELAKEGKIRKTIIRDPANNNRELAMFDARDIAKLALIPLGGAEFRLPGLPAPRPGPLATALAPAPRPQPKPVAPVIPPTAPPPLRPWLTLDEAEAYSGLPAGFLRRLIRENRLPAFDTGPRPDGKWRIARRDLDALSPQRAKSNPKS